MRFSPPPPLMQRDADVAALMLPMPPPRADYDAPLPPLR